MRVVVLASASLMLYYGLGYLFLVPRLAGVPYWITERFTRGLLPLFIGSVLAAICGRMAVHRPDSETLRDRCGGIRCTRFVAFQRSSSSSASAISSSTFRFDSVGKHRYRRSGTAWCQNALSANVSFFSVDRSHRKRFGRHAKLMERPQSKSAWPRGDGRGRHWQCGHPFEPLRSFGADGSPALHQAQADPSFPSQSCPPTRSAP